MKISVMSRPIAVVAISLLALAAMPANAYVLTNDPDCAVAAAAFDPAYDACVGAYVLGNGENDVTDGDDDNIVNQILNGDDVFGDGDWTFLEKDDGGSTTYVTVTGINSTSGSLTIADFGMDWPIEIAVSFKAAKDFSIYYWSALTGAPGEIDWSTVGTATNNNGGVQGLSHASVYYRNSTTTKIAEPGTLGLLGIGILGLGLARRRRAGL